MTKQLDTNSEEFWRDYAKLRDETLRIMKAKPVKNLNMLEVIYTLRLLELKALLAEGRYNQVVVHKNDSRLEGFDDADRFLAMLADCDSREVLLTTKRLIRNFGGTAYHWRKIAHKCPIIEVASAISEYSSGYYGRGWIIAPHICTLRKWILRTTEYSEIINLKL